MGTARDIPPSPFAQRVALACWAAIPPVVVLGVVAMLSSPEVFAETQDSSGATPWGGAIAGLALFLLFTAAPLAFFGHALRAGTRGRLTAALIGAAVLALYGGLLPLAGALVGGFEGVSAIAVLTAAGVAVLEAFVVAAALRELSGTHRDHGATA
jgi:hypothetical protein